VELSAFSDGYQKSTVHQVLVLVLVFQSHLPATPPFIALSSPGLPSDRPREGPLPTSSRWKARLGKSMQNVGTSAGHVSGASVGPQDLEDMELSHFQESSSLHHKHGRKDREEQEGEAQSPKRRSSISAVSTGPHLQPCLPGSSRPAFQPQSYFGHNVFECFGGTG
ncbi:hypothetical protein H1C71_035931, partial [Ictidomys tridecemlineatus]